MEVKKAEANSAISTSIITATQATTITSVVVSDIQEGNQSVTQTMVDLWNKVFEYSISPIKAYSNKRNEQILLFYGFSVLIIVCRLLTLVFWKREDGDVGSVAFYLTDIVANYSWICLGICQIVAIQEIAIRLKEIE